MKNLHSGFLYTIVYKKAERKSKVSGRIFPFCVEYDLGVKRWSSGWKNANSFRSGAGA
jgi:hypothetical protein